MSARVLVVDDDRSMVTTLCDILTFKGWTCDRAFSGEEAIRRASAFSPQIVLMDIKMDGMNGVEALRALRRDHPGVKVLLMTAYSATALVQEAREEGAMDVLSKPVDPAAVLALLGRVAQTANRILILEDNPAFLETLSSAVAQSGFAVDRTSSLDEALKVLEGGERAVVLMDMVLPGTEPEECVAAIRRASPSSLFILYSGYPATLERTRRTVPDSWVRACLHKPFDIEALIEVLDDAVH